MIYHFNSTSHLDNFLVMDLSHLESPTCNTTIPFRLTELLCDSCSKGWKERNGKNICTNLRDLENDDCKLKIPGVEKRSLFWWINCDETNVKSFSVFSLMNSKDLLFNGQESEETTSRVFITRVSKHSATCFGAMVAMK